MITGATDDIGKAYAFELTQRGIDVVLVSRNVQKLNKVAEEICELVWRVRIEAQSHTAAYAYPNVKVKIVQFDFTAQSATVYEEMFSTSELDKLDIGILSESVKSRYKRAIVLALIEVVFQLRVDSGSVCIRVELW